MSTDPPLRQIVSDTGPLISLEKITGGYRFIGRLYDRLIVPPAVIDELVAGQFETKEAISAISTPRNSWLSKSPPKPA